MLLVFEVGLQHLDELGEVLHLVLFELDRHDLAAVLGLLVLVRVLRPRVDVLHRRFEVLVHQLGLELLAAFEDGLVGALLTEGVRLSGLDISEFLYLLLHLYFKAREAEALISNKGKGKGKRQFKGCDNHDH